MCDNNTYCVILSGGIGSRFWPFSRTLLPKQFLDFFGVGRSMLQQTYDRFSKIFQSDHIFIATNELYSNLIETQLPDVKPSQILLEPARRNTAPSVAWASYHIRALNPNARILVTPSDHLILKEPELLDAIQKGLNHVANNDCLLTLGITPNRPETQYGYIQVEDPNDGFFHKVKTFTEKPEKELAEIFVQTGEFFWNAGLFMWNVNAIVKALEEYLPEIVAKLEPDNPVYGTPDEKRFIDERFPSCPNMSIDYGVMEKAQNVMVTLGDYGWSDVGTWRSLYDLSDKDENGNVTLKGYSQLYDARNNMVVLPKRKLAVIEGLEGYLVAESDNVLLICKKGDENSIRKYVNEALITQGEDYI